MKKLLNNIFYKSIVPLMILPKKATIFQYINLKNALKKFGTFKIIAIISRFDNEFDHLEEYTYINDTLIRNFDISQ